MKNLLVIIAIFIGASSFAAETPRRAAQRNPNEQEMLQLMEANRAGLMKDAETNIKVGDDIRDFELPDLGGMQVKSENLRKDKIFIVRLCEIESYFADAQIRFLNQIAEEYEGKVSVVDIVSKNDPSTFEQVLQKYEQKKVPYTILLDRGGVISEKYGIKSTPAVLIFDEKGKLLAARKQVDIFIFDEILDEIDIKRQEKK